MTRSHPAGPERTPGGLLHVDPETRAELLGPPRVAGAANPLPEGTLGERFAVHLSSAYFITDPEQWICALDDAEVLVFDEPLDTSYAMLIEPLEVFAREARTVLIAAPSTTGDALVFLIVNKLRGILHCAAVDADAATRARIAALVGAGRARRIVVAAGELAIAV